MRKLKNKKLWLKKYLPIAIAFAGLIGSQPLAFADNLESNRASNNQITVSDEDYDIVYGGGDEENAQSVSNNQVEVNGGEYGGVFGGVSADGRVYGNTVIIRDGNIQGAIGGLSVANNELNNMSGNVSGNRIIIHGGTLTYVAGGEVAYTYSFADGDNLSSYLLSLGNGNVTDNHVEINGGTINGRAVGGAALSGNAIGNTVEIKGGTINGEIIGGLSQNGDAKDNIVVINGAPDLINAYLYGGLSVNGTSSGNELRLKTTGITARNIGGFQNLNFDPRGAIKPGDTILTLTDGTTKLGKSHITFNTRGDVNLVKDDQINLIFNDNKIDLNSEMATSSDLEDGTAQLGNMTYADSMYQGTEKYGLGLGLSSDEKSLVATVGEYIPEEVPIPAPSPRPIFPPSIPAEDEFMNTQVEDVERVQEQHGYEIFFNSGGGHMKIKTGNGSYIKSDMGTHDLGIARHFKRNSGIFSFAPVIEYGYGKYDVHFPDSKYGEGHQQYTAGGVIIRNFNNSGFYYEGSVRAGRSDTTYSTNDFERNGVPTHIRYHAEAPILLSHVRIGNQWRMGKDHILDVYGYYAYARQGSSSTDLNVGDHYRFSSTDSGRLRTGYRLTSRLSPITQLYTGLAYQYDTNSDATSSTNGNAKNTIGKDGSSGMLEIGWLVRPLRDNPWTIDIHATGWVGMQEGVTAMAKVKKAF